MLFEQISRRGKANERECLRKNGSGCLQLIPPFACETFVSTWLPGWWRCYRSVCSTVPQTRLLPPSWIQQCLLEKGHCNRAFPPFASRIKQDHRERHWTLTWESSHPSVSVVCISALMTRGPQGLREEYRHWERLQGRGHHHFKLWGHYCLCWPQTFQHSWLWDHPHYCRNSSLTPFKKYNTLTGFLRLNFARIMLWLLTGTLGGGWTLLSLHPQEENSHSREDVGSVEAEPVSR